MTQSTSIQLILMDQKVAAPPAVDPDGVKHCDDIARVLIWIHSQVNILIHRKYAALEGLSAYSMQLLLNTSSAKDKGVCPDQVYLTDGLPQQLYSYYDGLKQIAMDPIMEARRSQAEDDSNLQKQTAEKIKRLRQLATMGLPRTPDGLARLRFHLDTPKNPEVDLVLVRPEEFSHALDLLADKEVEKPLTFDGTVSEIDEANGISLIRTKKKSLTYIHVPESMRKSVKKGMNSVFQVREKASTTKVNVYTLLDILDKESDE